MSPRAKAGSKKGPLGGARGASLGARKVHDLRNSLGVIGMRLELMAPLVPATARQHLELALSEVAAMGEQLTALSERLRTLEQEK